MKTKSSLDFKTRSNIESFAWDCTIGAGVDMDEKPEPSELDIKLLEKRLGHKLSAEEVTYLNTSWHKCQREMSQH